MAALDDITAATIGDERLSLGDVLRRAKHTGQLAFLKNAIEDRLITRAIEHRSIRTLPEELERARTLFTSDHHLTTDAELDLWLASRKMTRDDLDRDLR
jgi:hypothetical protein